MKTRYHFDECDYCGRLASTYTEMHSGEPVSLCDNGHCHARHREVIEGERYNLEQKKPVPRTKRVRNNES